MGNKYNNTLNTRNYRLSVPRDINVDNINFTRDR